MRAVEQREQRHTGHKADAGAQQHADWAAEQADDSADDPAESGVVGLVVAVLVSVGHHDGSVYVLHYRHFQNSEVGRRLVVLQAVELLVGLPLVFEGDQNHVIHERSFVSLRMGRRAARVAWAARPAGNATAPQSAAHLRV